jgi:hypothetical protein
MRTEPPAVAGIAKTVHEGNGTWRMLMADGTPPHAVLTALVQAGAVVDSFEPVLAPMEDIFLRVVREGRE